MAILRGIRLMINIAKNASIAVKEEIQQNQTKIHN